IPKEAKERLKAKGFELVDAEEENLEDHPVQVIVGVDFYGDVWNGMETRRTNDLHVRESIFGWVVFGVAAANPDEAFACINIICTDDDEYEAKVPAPSADFNKKLEAEYLNEFIASKVTRLEGTYSVRLPWLTPVNLASNK